jgi:hypothetical protein
MDPPKSKQQLRQFIGLVWWSRYMWPTRSHVVAPLSDLAAKNAAFRWRPSHQQAFEAVKRVVSRKAMLSFPDYEQPFDFHTDASDLKLGAVLMQDKNILALFSRKPNDPQHKMVLEKRNVKCSRSAKGVHHFANWQSVRVPT